MFYSYRMRWETQLVDRQQEGERLPLGNTEALVRRFNTPEFRGVTFYEIFAKSIINHVPGERFGFNWTINPYRGCSHSCSYCLQGDTPILLANGRTKPLLEIEIGDTVYGTVRVGNYRRYVPTEVLDHWETRKPAYRVTLEDGTELVASADHRFLSDRGWKHVTGTENGPDQRPHLTKNNKLMGLGQLVAGPSTHKPDYRRGYLCGIIRGDGNLGTYTYQRAGRRHGTVHRFRLALIDMEALRRSRQYLAELNIETKEFLFQKAAGNNHESYAIRTQSSGNVLAIQEIIRWPKRASLDWAKGFLAGIFDAEGSFLEGILRIANTDLELIGWITRCLRRLGFFFVLEQTTGRNRPLHVVRLLGELSEKLRFFLTVDPAITRKRIFHGTAIKSSSRLKVASIEDLGVEIPMYDITTGTGDFIANGVVSHNCFARPTHTYLDLNAGTDFDTKIVVKVNAVELLARELRKKSWTGESIAMGTNTDPYQRAEGHYKLTRGILKELNAVRNPYSILTKGTLIQRDIDLLQEGASVTDVHANFSVGTVNEEVWKKTEPGTPHPMKRLEVVGKLNEAGIPCGVLMAPILPGISDSPEQLEATVKAIAESGATHISPIVLHLRPGVKEEFLPWLESAYPNLIRPYEEMYKRTNAPKETRERIGKTVANYRRKYGGGLYEKTVEKSKEQREDSQTQLSLDLDLGARRAPKWVKENLNTAAS